MKRPVVPDAIRLIITAVGICCLMVPLLIFCFFRDWKMTDGFVRIFPLVEDGQTNIHKGIAYTWAERQWEWVYSAEVPAGARNGDRLKVLYNPERVIDSWLLRDVLRLPIYAAAFGVALTSLGLFLRSRKKLAIGSRLKELLDALGEGGGDTA